MYVFSEVEALDLNYDLNYDTMFIATVRTIDNVKGGLFHILDKSIKGDYEPIKLKDQNFIEFSKLKVFKKLKKEEDVK